MDDPGALVSLLVPFLVFVLIFCVFLQMLFCFMIEVIAKKQELPAPWLAWIPVLQLYPMLRSGDGSIIQFLVLMLSLVAVGLASVLLAPVLSPIVGVVLLLAWGIWASVYFGRLLWNTALRRNVSGWVGMLVFVPFVGLFAYLYIAFHDGFEPPTKLGVALGILLYVLPTLPALRADSPLQQMAQIGTLMSQGDQEGAALLLQQMAAAGGGEADPAQLEAMMDELSSAFSRSQGASSTPTRELPAGFDRETGFATSNAFECPEGTKERGGVPPARDEHWCERTTPLGTAREGPYAAWHANGQLREAGTYLDGERVGVWTRWYESGGKHTQAQFRAGLQHGVLIAWDELGRKQREIYYRDGEPTGG